MNQPQVLFTAEDIARRVAELGQEITDYYRGKELTVLALPNGAIPFVADLIRKIDLPLFLDTVAVGSYQHDVSSGKISFRSNMKLNVTGRHVLLVDEVLDSGKTLQALTEYVQERGAASVRSVVIVRKNIPNRPGMSCTDWIGFEAADDYLVGYGMDSDEYYRNLPYIGVLKYPNP